MNYHSLSEEKHCSLGKNKSPIINHNSTFNTLRKLQKYSTFHLTWNQYCKNPDISAVEEYSPISRSSGFVTSQFT
jgi:hypothetical protein